MEIVIMTKTKTSYDRISADFNNEYKFRYVKQFNELNQLRFYTEIVIVLVDPLHEEFQDIELCCNMNNIDLISFTGNFNKAIKDIQQIIDMRHISEEVIEQVEINPSSSDDDEDTDEAATTKLKPTNELTEEIQEETIKTEEQQLGYRRIDVYNTNKQAEEETINAEEQEEEKVQIKKKIQLFSTLKGKLFSRKKGDIVSEGTHTEHDITSTESAAEATVETDKEVAAATQSNHTSDTGKSKEYVDDFLDEMLTEASEKFLNKKTKVKLISIKPKIIVVGGLWSGAGATQLSLLLAHIVQKNDIEVNYFEFCNNPYIKGLFDMEHSTSLHHEVVKPFNVENINYFYLEHENLTNVEIYENVIKYRTPINIIDIGTNWELAQDLIYQSDLVLCLIEPDISKINKIELTRLQAVNQETNRFNLVKQIAREVDVKTCLMKYLPQNEELLDEVKSIELFQDIQTIPYISYESINLALQNQELIYQQPKIRKKYIKQARHLLHQVLPKEITLH